MLSRTIEMGIVKSMDWFMTACFHRAVGMSGEKFEKKFGTALPSVKNLMWFSKIHNVRIRKFFEEEQKLKDEIFGKDHSRQPYIN